MPEEGIRIPIKYSDLPSHKLFACEPPSVIYHYTNYEGAKGIIENKSLWLTKLSYLNDTTELRLAIDLFRNIARKKAQELTDQEKRKFLKDASHQLQSFEETNICVVCFCESGDLLSQWRSYGNASKGIALEFNANSLKRLSNTGLMNLWKCLYNTSEHIKVISELIDMLLNSYDVVSEGRQRNEAWEKTKEGLIGYFNSTFLQIAPVIKNSHFHEEKE